MRKFLLPLLLSLFAFLLWQKESVTSSYQVLTPDSVTDSVWMKELGVKQERLRFKNGLNVWLIEAPSTARSMMAVSIKSGTLEDPIETMGCAHLVEHMLFLGSNEYPEEDGFSSFVKKASGTTNAMTSPTSTLYGFTCSNGQIEEGFNRLSDMVQNPLLRQESIDREKQAVNEEFLQKIPNQSYKNWLTLCHLTGEAHPLSRLGCGNAQTLKNVSAKDLQNWHQAHYAPDNASVILFTSKGLNEQRKWVQDKWAKWEKTAQKDFLLTPNVEWSFDTENIIKQVANDGKNTLDLVWFIPLSKPQEALSLSHLSSWLGHEFSGGICSELKKQGLALSVSCGSQTMANLGLLSISIDLTSKGKDSIDTCLSLCQSYIDFLGKQSVSDKWLIERQNIVKNAWATSTFQASLDLAFSLAENITQESLETFPYNLSWPTETSVLKAQSIAQTLSVGKAAKLVCLAPEVKLEKTTLIKSGIEPWANTPYEILAIENKKPSEISSITWKRAPDNPFLPQTLPQFLRFTSNETAQIIQRPFGNLIYYQNTFEGGLNDSLFWAVEAVDVSSTIDRVCFWPLFTLITNETTQELRHQVQEAGQSFSITSQTSGISFQLAGYSSNVQQQLLQDLFESITKADVSQELFEQQKQLFLDNLRASLKQGPLAQLSSMMRKNFTHEGCNTQEVIEHTEQMSFEDFQNMYAHFKHAPLRFHVVAVSSKEAENWTHCFEKIHRSCNSVENKQEESFPCYPFTVKWQTPAQESTYYHDLKEGNLVVFAWPLGELEASEKSSFLKMKVYEPLLELSAFDNLRTKQQLGYVVRACLTTIGDQKTLILFVLSSNKTSEQVTTAMKEQIQLWKKQIEETSQEQFNSYCQQQLRQISEPIETSQELLSLCLALWPYEEDPFQILGKQKQFFEKISPEEAKQNALQVLSNEPYILKCLPKSKPAE